jgi:hypothetical protein
MDAPDTLHCTEDDHVFNLPPSGLASPDLRCACGAVTWAEMDASVKEATPDDEDAEPA